MSSEVYDLKVCGKGEAAPLYIHLYQIGAMI